MKEILLKNVVIEYLQKEIVKTRNTHPEVLSDIRDPSFVQGYKEGKLQALQQVFNHVMFYM